MNDVEQQQELLDQLVEEFAGRCRRGESPALKEYEQRFPALADRLRELLPPVALLEEFKRGRGRASGNLDPAGGVKLEQLGDFRLVREIGRGGMGIVYEAVQQSLGRRVAVKVLPRHALADPKRLDRFRREAQAVARLHHTNVVPVFGLFEADGWHFYVMQFIDGRGLDQVLAELKRGNSARDTKAHGPSTVGNLFSTAHPSQSAVAPMIKVAAGTHPGVSPRAGAYFRDIATLIAQAAAALGYAHDQGVLHRDIKPANLLLDQRGSIWITDFGLARLAENDRLTNPGDVLGTLQYLAPESFQGETGPRSDVYSLGLTLYELLTLRSPFVESQPGRLLREICEGPLPRPRQIRSDIPRDLETITLKAIARDPALRYQSAGELAADLQRFLADLPIHARQAGAAERLWRWSRRNRALASLGSVALGSLLIAAMVGWLAYVSTTQALRREATKRVEAESATTRAEQNMQLSLGALEEIFLALAPPQVPGERQLEGHRPYPPPRPPGPGRNLNDDANRPPGHSAKEAQLLQTVLEFYERFAATNATNTRLKREAARSYRRVGDIHARENELSAAAESYQHACTLFAELIIEGADQGNALAELIETKLRHADALGPTEPAGRQGELLAEAAQMGQTLAEDFPEVGRFKLLLAHVHRNRAKALQRQGNDSAAEKDLRHAAELATEALDCADVARIGVSELARCQAALARFLITKQRTSEALQVIENSISTLEAAPPSREIHDALAEQHDLFDEILGPKGPPRRRGDGPPHRAPRP